MSFRKKNILKIQSKNHEIEMDRPAKPERSVKELEPSLLCALHSHIQNLKKKITIRHIRLQLAKMWELISGYAEKKNVRNQIAIIDSFRITRYKCKWKWQSLTVYFNIFMFVHIECNEKKTNSNHIKLKWQ